MMRPTAELEEARATASDDRTRQELDLAAATDGEEMEIHVPSNEEDKAVRTGTATATAMAAADIDTAKMEPLRGLRRAKRKSDAAGTASNNPNAAAAAPPPPPPPPPVEVESTIKRGRRRTQEELDTKKRAQNKATNIMPQLRGLGKNQEKRSRSSTGEVVPNIMPQLCGLGKNQPHQVHLSDAPLALEDKKRQPKHYKLLHFLPSRPLRTVPITAELEHDTTTLAHTDTATDPELANHVAGTATASATATTHTTEVRPGALAVQGIGSTGQSMNINGSLVDDVDINGATDDGGDQVRDASPPVADLAVADPVTEPNLPTAEEIDLSKQQEYVKNRRTKTALQVWTLYGGCFLLLVVAVILAVVFRTKGNNEEVPTLANPVGGKEESAIAPTNASGPTMSQAELHVRQCLPNYTIATMEHDANSPQQKAFDWLISDPFLETYVDHDWRLLQRYALATFYYATSGDTWISTNKKHWVDYDVHECHWEAYSYSELMAHIESLSEVFDIYQLGLLMDQASVIHENPCGDFHDFYTGFPSDGVYQHLWQVFNPLAGSVPPELFLLTSLKSIILAFHELHGTMPTQIGQITNLEAAIIYSTKLSGTIPSEIGRLHLLKGLLLSENACHGAIPSEIGKLSQLAGLIIQQENLEFFVPTEIGSLSSLQYLYLDHDLLTGSIPSEVGGLNNLQELDLDSNDLTGSIPSEIGSLSSLYYLNLTHNFLTGSIPSEVGRLTNLLVLELDSNDLTGSIPSEIGSLSHLVWLLLSNNQLTGPVPSEITSLTNLHYSNMINNQLTGIP